MTGYSKKSSPGKETVEGRNEWVDIFQAIGHPAVIMDPTHGLIAANLATQIAAGMTEEQLIGKKCHEIFHHSSRVPSRCPMESLLAGGTGDRVEMEMEAFNGTYLVSCTGVYNDQGVVERIIHIATDISDKKRQELELKAYWEHLEEIVEDRTNELEIKNWQLLESQKALTHLLEDVNESRAELQQVVHKMAEANHELEAFSYSVSHDLKAPLRAIDGFSHILLEDYYAVLDEKGKRYLSIVRENTQQMGNLIQDLLEYSRVGRVKVRAEHVCLRDTISGIMDMLLKNEAHRSFRIDLKEIPDIFVDPTLVRQVYTNLLSNSIKFTRTKKISRITVGCTETSYHLTFYVKDNGVGFDMKYAKKLFNVFQRLHTPDEYEGTGVGLAIVHRIVKRLGGSMDARSNPGKGTTISFKLPKKSVLLPPNPDPDENHQNN